MWWEAEGHFAARCVGHDMPATLAWCLTVCNAGTTTRDPTIVRAGNFAYFVMGKHKERKGGGTRNKFLKQIISLSLAHTHADAK